LRFTGFIGPSYTLRSVNVDCQRCVNLYPELNELGTGKEKEVAALVGTPGLSLLLTLPKSPVRGIYYSSTGKLYAVGQNTIYSISSAYVATSIGTLNSNSGPVSMADNGVHLAIVDGSTTGSLVTLATNVVTAIPFPGDIDFETFAGVDQVTYQDGYFIFNHKTTGQFFISGILGSAVADDTTIDALDFSSSDGAPDPIVSILSVHRDLWIFNAKTTEVFFNSGNVFPFDRIQGAFIEVGCAAAFSVAKMNNAVFWLGQDERGNGVVYMASGYQPQRISTSAVELAIQSYGTISDAVAFCYQENGHNFYCLNFSAANTTWVFDSSTSLWHERSYMNNGTAQRHLANSHAFAYGIHVVGDYSSGNIYQMSSSVYTDNGAAIVRKRAAPHVSQDMVRLFHTRLQLDLEPGVGLDGTGQGTDPQAILRFSNDGGHVWSNEKWTGIGKIGQTKNRAIWNRLGYARDRVYEITISDPNKIVLIGAELDVTSGES
jgi:hypothetical protein